MARKITDKQIIATYSRKGCNISATCLALDISRKTFYARRHRNAKLDEALTAIEEMVIDNAESKLLEKINDGDITALIFFLKTKGKNRGYVETIQQNVSINPFQEALESVEDDE